MKYLPFLLLIMACQSPVAPVVKVVTPQPTETAAATDTAETTTTTETTTTETTKPATVTGKTVSVLNSLWKVVKQDTLSGRAIDSTAAIQAEIDAYNAKSIADQWFLVEGEVPDLDHAPAANVFIVDRVTHLPISYPDGAGGTIFVSHENWPRRLLVENYDGFVKDAVAANGELYVDVIPPPPPKPTAEDLYTKYSIYVINNAGAVKYEFHCDVVPDGWPGYTVPQYFSAQLARAQLICTTDGAGQVDSPWTYLSGSLYTDSGVTQ